MAIQQFSMCILILCLFIAIECQFLNGNVFVMVVKQNLFDQLVWDLESNIKKNEGHPIPKVSSRSRLVLHLFFLRWTYGQTSHMTLDSTVGSCVFRLMHGLEQNTLTTVERVQVDSVELAPQLTKITCQ